MQQVFYVAYGSNLDRQRFACYLQGGRAPGAQRTLPGSRDHSPPRADVPTTLGHRLRFASGSPSWGGGVAFVDPQAEADVATLGRAWLVSVPQAADVLAQENGWDPAGAGALTNAIERAHHDGLAVVDPGGRYGAVVALADIDGQPAVTFTSPVPAAPTAPPDAAYLGVIARGLAEAHALDADAVVEYLSGAPGIAGRLDDDALSQRVSTGSTRDDPDPPGPAHPPTGAQRRS